MELLEVWSVDQKSSKPCPEETEWFQPTEGMDVNSNRLFVVVLCKFLCLPHRDALGGPTPEDGCIRFGLQASRRIRNRDKLDYVLLPESPDSL